MKSDTSCTTLGTQSGAPSYQSTTICMKNIDDLPEFLLSEILCRLPYKFVIRSKCVCKSWLTLISRPYFQTRHRALYLRNKYADTDQILLSAETTLFGRHARELFTISNQTDGPVLKQLHIDPRSRIPSLYEETDTVEATYNDLILFREGQGYLICNPYTSQWFAVPPPNFPSIAGAGFICDSDYRCRIVRFLGATVEEASVQFVVEVFTSETGQWSKRTVSHINIPYMLRLYNLMISRPALAYDGMLYWLGTDGFLICLDPFSKLDDNYHCRLVSSPPDPVNSREFYTECLGVCRGSVRRCRLYDNSVCLWLWELKKEDGDSEVDGVGGKMMTWCLKERVQLRQTGLGLLLALDPNDEDIIYLKRIVWRDGGAANIVTCNIRTGKVTEIPEKFPCYDFLIEAFPFKLPWWPTPVPS